MKKSEKVLLSAVMIAAIASCRSRPDDEWVSGLDEHGKGRDTMVNNQHYRYYHGSWFPIIMGRISPSTYTGASTRDLVSPGYHSTHHSSGFRSGGFGHSSHSSFHSSGHS